MDDSGRDPGAERAEHREHGERSPSASPPGDLSDERFKPVEVTSAHRLVLEYLQRCTGPASERTIAERCLGRWARWHTTQEVLLDLEGLGAVEAGPTFLKTSSVGPTELLERQTWVATDAGRRSFFLYCHGEPAIGVPMDEGHPVIVRCSRCGTHLSVVFPSA